MSQCIAETHLAILANPVALPACRDPAGGRKQHKWCAVAERLSTGTFWRVAISGTKPPFIAACIALCSQWFEVGTVRNMALRANLYLLRDPVLRPILVAQMHFGPGLLIEPFGYTPTAMPVGCISRHGLELPQNRHWSFSSIAPVIHKRESDLDSPIISTSILVRVWLRHSLQVFTVSLFDRTWAQCILLPSLHHQNPDLDRPAIPFLVCFTP